jgi:putative NIF3 family GTP cyclohydrolase 1 type 2
MNPISRREFVIAGGAVVSQIALGQTGKPQLTAGDVVERIKKNVGVPWLTMTVDHLVAGDESIPVQGIASVMMATQEVIERAAAEGKNMIVTHETPYYLHQDKTDDIRGNAVLQYKLDFLKKHNLAIFHFHDHWHAHHPDGIAQGMMKQLGWEQYVDDAANPKHFTFPGTPLAKFAKDISDRLHDHNMRVVGDPSLPVRKVQASWGNCGREAGIPIMSKPDVDVLVCGETREWELVEYARDAVTIGQKKGLVVIGHVLSEQGGMILCADWLKSFITEVPIAYIPTPEPFWNPSHPTKAEAA